MLTGAGVRTGWLLSVCTLALLTAACDEDNDNEKQDLRMLDRQWAALEVRMLDALKEHHATSLRLRSVPLPPGTDRDHLEAALAKLDRSLTALETALHGYQTQVAELRARGRAVPFEALLDRARAEGPVVIRRVKDSAEGAEGADHRARIEGEIRDCDSPDCFDTSGRATRSR